MNTKVKNDNLTIAIRILAGVLFVVIIPAITGLGYFLLALGGLIQGDFSPNILLIVLVGIAYLKIETGMFVLAAGIVKPEQGRYRWAFALLFFGIGFVTSAHLNGWNDFNMWMMVWLVPFILSLTGFVLSLFLKRPEEVQISNSDLDEIPKN